MQHCTVFVYVLVQKPDGSYCGHNQMDFCKTKKQYSLDDYFGINTSVIYPETVNYIAGEKTKTRTLPGARGFEIMRPRGEGGGGRDPAYLTGSPEGKANCSRKYITLLCQDSLKHPVQEEQVISLSSRENKVFLQCS